MKGIEKLLVVGAIVNMAIYIPWFFWVILTASSQNDIPLKLLIPWHIGGMLLSLAAYILTIRDLYLRSFDNPNAKLTWSLLMQWTGGIAWVAYVVNHAFKPRQ